MKFTKVWMIELFLVVLFSRIPVRVLRPLIVLRIIRHLWLTSWETFGRSTVFVELSMCDHTFTNELKQRRLTLLVLFFLKFYLSHLSREIIRWCELWMRIQMVLLTLTLCLEWVFLIYLLLFMKQTSNFRCVWREMLNGTSYFALQSLSMTYKSLHWMSLWEIARLLIFVSCGAG